MQELNDSIKRPNLRIMGIEEEMEEKGMCNIFNIIITEKFPNLTEYAHTNTGSLQNSKRTLQ
jgi:hypothetical protein